MEISAHTNEIKAASLRKFISLGRCFRLTIVLQSLRAITTRKYHTSKIHFPTIWLILLITTVKKSQTSKIYYPFGGNGSLITTVKN